MNHTHHDFLAHHAPWGAYSSFILGNVGRGGGFALSDVHSPEQSVYLGFRRGSQQALVMPFLGKTGANADDFSSGAVARGNLERGIRIVESHEFTRDYRWASDAWTLDGLRFCIHSPFGLVPPLEHLDDRSRRLATCPCVVATIEFDNRASSEPVRVLFALNGVTRPLETDSSGRLLGAAHRRAWGLATRSQPNVQEIQAFDVLGQAFAGHATFPPHTLRHRLGGAGGILLSVPPGEIGRAVIALGTYQAGTVTSGQEACFAYTDDFPSLESALEFALDHSDAYLSMSLQRDAELLASGLDANQQFLIAHATHGYLANTELLRLNDSRKLLWVVNEGEYRMMNTLDLSVDHLHWESRYHPWTIANVLEHFLESYSFQDTLQDGRPGGLSFPHDMGVSNAFSPPGESAYELSGLNGCFSHMTIEQLLNWTLCATTYGLRHDTPWLERHREALLHCCDSIVARDADGDGVIDTDSARCGSGIELTTYDNVDEALGRSRSSTYLASKTWGALELLACALERIGVDGSRLRERAGRIVETITRVAAARSDGALPSHLDAGADDALVLAIPAIEGLSYPLALNLPIPDALRAVMRRHLETALRGGCLTPRGGWRLSGGSENTWMSKVFLNQFVASHLGVTVEPRSHAEHARWQQIGSSQTGVTDQVHIADGAPLGSKLYPRLVTSILWLEGNQAHMTAPPRTTARS
jgi:xylan 1,4-beta-xylosidase